MFWLLTPFFFCKVNFDDPGNQRYRASAFDDDSA